jgi:succinyl-CoA synthetase alpha subunit
MSILIDANTNVMVQAITGTQGRIDVRRMLAFGTRLVAGVTPGKGGQQVDGVPVFDSVAEAAAAHRIDLVMSYVPPRFIRDAVLDVVAAGIPTMAISAERIPIHDLASLLKAAREGGTRIIGPNTLGIVSPGKALLGGIGGETPGRALMPGPVGIMSKSGGMGAELCWILRRAGLGQSTYVSLGGEAMSGTSFRDLLELFEADPETRAVVMWGEAGAPYEEEAARFVRDGGFTKPLVAVVAGRFTERLPGVRFGHGGTIIEGGSGAPSAKVRALQEAGVTVVERLSEIPVRIGEALGVPVTAEAPGEKVTA